MLDPLPLVQGLRLLGHVASKRKHWREPGSWSRVYVRDAMVFSFRDTVLGVVQAAGLAGLEAMVHVANLAPVTAIVGRLDGSLTGLSPPSTTACSRTRGPGSACGPRPISRSGSPRQSELSAAPQAERRDRGSRSDMLPALDRLLAATKGEPGAEWVRLRVKGLGASARWSCRPRTDRNGIAASTSLSAAARPSWTPGRAQSRRHASQNRALRDLVDYFCSTFEFTNVVLDVLPPTAVFPRPVLRLRYEVEGKGGYTVARSLPDREVVAVPRAEFPPPGPAAPLEEDACWAHLERYRWPGGPVCPDCERVRTAHPWRGRRHRWRCAACGCRFHAAQGTAIEGTHLPLVAWFAAVQLLAEVPRLSSARLGRALGLRQKTAWSLARRTRRLAAEDPLLHRVIVNVVQHGTTGTDVTRPRACPAPLKRRWATGHASMIQRLRVCQPGGGSCHESA